MNNFEKLLLQKDEEITRLKNRLERYEKPKKQGKGSYGIGSIRLISKTKGSYLLRYKRLNKMIYATTRSDANSQQKQWVHEVDTNQYTNRGKLTVDRISLAASGCLAVASAAEENIFPIPSPAPITANPAPIAAPKNLSPSISICFNLLLFINV